MDFEGRNPVDSDFHGIRQLLKQLLPKAPVNLSELSDLIIGQNYIGSVVTQCEDAGDDEADDENEDEDMEDEANTIFGITTAINLTQKATIGCVKELRDHLLDRTKRHADSATQKQIRTILTSTEQSVGFLLNERYVNIPAQISVPLLESLTQEIKRANSKGMAYDFAYYVMLVKFYRSQAGSQSKKGKPAAATDEYYTNAEEEVFCEEALCTFEYSVKGEAESSNGGEDGVALATDDSGLVPFRQLVLFEAKKLPGLIETIKKLTES